MSEVPHQPAVPSEGLPEYVRGGGYYDLDPGRHGEDATFKAHHFFRLFDPAATKRGWRVRTYADVGCGSGLAAHAVLDGLRRLGHPVSEAWGYDVYPGVESIPSGAGVHFVRGDFAAARQHVDLVTLFDVLEHVPDPIGFLRSIADRCHYMGLHIPLENNLNHSVRDRYRSKLLNPGHLVFMDVCQSLTLLSFAGLRVVGYGYTPGFRAPSGGQSLLARIARLPRTVIWWLSPWMLSKTLGGSSLMVLAETRTGWKEGL